MKIEDLKTELLHQIVEIGQNEDDLQKILDFVIKVQENRETPPFITDESLGEYIKEDSSIIVPIVCDDMFEYIKDGKSFPVSYYICDNYKEKWGIKDEVVKAIKSNFYFGLSLYEQDKRGINRSKSIYEAIENGISNGEIVIKNCVREFLFKGNFPVIVTTIGFPILESALSDKGYESEWYNPTRRNDLPLIKDEHTRVIYHIFGGENSNAWVYNDQTLLKYVHTLHSGDFCAKNLANYLRGTGNDCVKRPLVLGSTLPDWLFRFFVYPLYGEKLPESNGYWMSLDDIEKGLDMFLNRNKYTGQINLRKENRIDEILTEASVERNLTNREIQKPYKIFISYKREQENSVNAEKIERICELLRKQAKATGGDIWRDREQVADGGNPYWANIKKAVKECNLFVPLISHRYLEEYRNAPDIAKYAERPIVEADFDNANDVKEIMALNPVIREAYYAISYEKICVPIVIADEQGILNGGTTEDIIRDSTDNRNIPSCIFGEHTNLVHDDNNPQFFNLPKID